MRYNLPHSKCTSLCLTFPIILGGWQTAGGRHRLRTDRLEECWNDTSQTGKWHINSDSVTCGVLQRNYACIHLFTIVFIILTNKYDNIYDKQNPYSWFQFVIVELACCMSTIVAFHPLVWSRCLELDSWAYLALASSADTVDPQRVAGGWPQALTHML